MCYMGSVLHDVEGGPKKKKKKKKKNVGTLGAPYILQ